MLDAIGWIFGGVFGLGLVGILIVLGGIFLILLLVREVIGAIRWLIPSRKSKRIGRRDDR